MEWNVKLLVFHFPPLHVQLESIICGLGVRQCRILWFRKWSSFHFNYLHQAEEPIKSFSDCIAASSLLLTRQMLTLLGLVPAFGHASSVIPRNRPHANCGGSSRGLRTLVYGLWFLVWQMFQIAIGSVLLVAGVGKLCVAAVRDSF